MKPMPSLIPRFNFDYTFNDFTYGLKSTFANSSDFDLSYLESIFGNKSFFFTNAGRSSLYVILRALNLPKDSKIGVPLYLCTVVFDAIIKAGHVPYFIDIDLNNYTMDPEDLKEKIENIDAIVVVHTFGRPADMDKNMKIAKADGIPVIEDCAHSLLSEYKGKKTGTMGVASFFSFRSRKYISAGEGSMIILNEDKFKDNFQREINLLDEPSSLNEIIHSFFTYTYSFLYHKPWYGMFAFPLGSYVKDKIKNDGKREFEVKKIRKNDLKIFLRKLEVFKEKVEQQRRNSQILIEELQDTSLILPYENKDTYCNYYLFPVMFENREKRDLACNYLRSMGVDTAKLWSMTPSVARRIYGYYKGDCPNTEKWADSLLAIPNYYTLNENELLKIADNVKKLDKIS